jgi:predicted glycosyltransferase involved in capsule biosynthesis
MAEKFDFLYVFNYAPPFLEQAILRLRCSLKSIRSQNIRICLANYSNSCIHKEIEDLVPGMQYIHIPYTGPFSKSLFINHAVKKMINSEYFILSDVDLVYSRDHVQKVNQKMESLSRGNDKFRFVTYNYNLAPVYKSTMHHLISKIPFIGKVVDYETFVRSHPYTDDYIVLDRMRINNSGYAHGPGVIHTPTFFEIRGYDEELIGHGPEDDMFNTRIGKVNRLVYDNLPDTATFHLWHPMLQQIQVEQNMQIWYERKIYLDSLENATVEDVRANKNKADWGVV